MTDKPESGDVITTKEADYLEQDESIRNQNYVCLSFISPEDVLKKKEHFFFEKYVSAFVKKNQEFADVLQNLFPDKKDEIRILKDNFEYLFDEGKIHDNYKHFVQDNESVIEKEFYEKNAFQTCIRGIKVRGTYDTLDEAKARSERLRKLDGNKFSIYVAQVGCWCPWSPNPDSIADQEFAESALNTLMARYKENQDNKEIHFKERQAQMKEAIAENEQTRKEAREADSMGESSSSSMLEGSELPDQSGEDPWTTQRANKGLAQEKL